MQAAADVPGALDNVKALLNHEAFDASNPNRYRSVVNTFAGANPAHFHAADGSGYKFVADETHRDGLRNPQVAARLAGSFNQVTAIGPATHTPSATTTSTATASTLPHLHPSSVRSVEEVRREAAGADEGAARAHQGARGPLEGQLRDRLARAQVSAARAQRVGETI